MGKRKNIVHAQYDQKTVMHCVIGDLLSATVNRLIIFYIYIHIFLIFAVATMMMISGGEAAYDYVYTASACDKHNVMSVCVVSCLHLSCAVPPNRRGVNIKS